MQPADATPDIPPEVGAALFPRIAILGAGALGLYYGGRLALAGNEVHFVARGDHAAIASAGIILHEGSGESRLHPVHVHTTPEAIGPVDLVLITLKTTANGELGRLLPPLVSGRTLVVTLQNGLGNEDLLARLVPPGNVGGGLCFIATMRTAPGEVRCFQRGSITLGAYRRPAGTRTRALGSLFQHAGIDARVVDDLENARWRKLVWNVPFNGLSIAAGGITTDVICASPTLTAEVQALMAEIREAAAALGHEIPEEFARKQYDVTPPMGPYRPSSLVDYLEKRPVEVEPIWGEPLRRAQAAGVRVPRMALLYALLKQLVGANAAKP